jgi:hypothetical protein
VPHFRDRDARDLFDDWVLQGCPSGVAPSSQDYSASELIGFPIPALMMCDLMARCSDILPSRIYEEACRLYGIRPRKRTYAAMARDLGRIIRSRKGAVS